MTYRIIPDDPNLVAAWDFEQDVAGNVPDVLGVNPATLVGQPRQGSDRFGHFLRCVTHGEALDTGPLDQSGEFSILLAAYMETPPVNQWLIGDQVATTKIGTVGSNYFIRVTDGGTSDTSVPFVEGFNLLMVTRDANDKIDFYRNGGAAVRLFSDVAKAGLSEWSRLLNQNDLAALHGLYGKMYAAAVYNVARSAAWIEQEYKRAKIYF